MGLPQGQTITIMSDSQSALQAIANPSNKSGQHIVHSILAAAKSLITYNIRIRLQLPRCLCGRIRLRHKSGWTTFQSTSMPGKRLMRSGCDHSFTLVFSHCICFHDSWGPGQTPHAQVIPCLLLKHVSSGIPVLGRHHRVLLGRTLGLSASEVARSCLSTHRHAHLSSRATQAISQVPNEPAVTAITHYAPRAELVSRYLARSPSSRPSMSRQENVLTTPSPAVRSTLSH
jgi:hypothetical protein